MDNKYKAIAAKCARDKKTKLELMMLVPNANPSEVKQINLFYEMSKEIIILSKSGESDEVLRQVIKKMGFSENDLDLILGRKELKHVAASALSTLVSVVFILAFVFVAGSLLINILNTTDWDFLKKDCLVSGFVFGEDVNFDDLKITSNAVLKDFSVNGSEYTATVRCSKGFTLSFKKDGFVPVHKNLDCENQNIDIAFATMNEFVKLDMNKTTDVEDKGVKLDVNGSDLVILGTNTPAVNPSVSVTAFNPNTPGDMQYFPGELEGLQKDGNVTGLESYGFAKIIAQDDNGNNLDFKEGTSAKLTFAIDESQKADAPEEIPLWYFDEDKGTWVEESTAKKVCNGDTCMYVGEMNRVRSSWNADHPVPTFQRDINDWNAQGDKKCPEERPVEVYGLGAYASGAKSENYICCPDKASVFAKAPDPVYVGGNPTQCSCPESSPQRFFKADSNTAVCCSNEAKFALEPWHLDPQYTKCGKCTYGPDESPMMACESNCSICRGESIVTLDSGSGEKCDEEFFRDCSKEGKICVEHVSSALADPYASCECPDSLTFATANYDFHALFSDGYKYLGRFASQNTFYTLFDPNSIFEKVTALCKSSCGKKIRLIFANHGHLGSIVFGNDNARIGLDQLSIIKSSVANGGYDFSCVKEVVWDGCSVGAGSKGEDFLFASATAFNATSYASNNTVCRGFSDGGDYTTPSEIVRVRPPWSFFNIHTIFYATSNDLIFPGIPSEAYQTKILDGNLGQVKLYVSSSDSSRNMVASIDDKNMLCPSKIIKSKIFTIDSQTSSINFDNFKMEIPSGSVIFGKTVKLQISKLDINCTDVETDYLQVPSMIDNDYLQTVKNAFDEGLLLESSYNKAKTLYDNNWLCVEDSDCFGPCPMGDLNCSYGCTQNHECKITSSDFNLRYVPSTSVVEESSSDNYEFDSHLINPNNKFAFMVIGQSISKRPVAYGDIGKNISFSYLGYNPPKIAFTINSVPSAPQSLSSVPSSGAVFSGYSLNNCSLWNGYPSDLADCVSGYDSLYGLNSDEALSYLGDLNLSGKDKGVIGTKLADYYNDVNFCYYALKGDYYSGLACIKTIDKEKEIDSNKNISNILLQGLNDYSLSFVLRNLAEYYWDKNYCEPIPTPSQKEACIGRFPKEPEVVVPVVLCGNGVIDNKEKCDGDNFGGLTCAAYGFNRGNLFCVNCQINRSGCYNYNEPSTADENEPVSPDNPPTEDVCGDGVMNGNEDCDGTDFGGMDCSDYGFNSGSLSCTSDCRISSTGCSNVTAQTCGNGVIEGTEQCEGTNFNGKTCDNYGYNAGTLTCSNCQIVKTNCKTEVAPPEEIDPLEVFDCPYNEAYSSPIKDTVNNYFWIKEVYNNEVYALKLPFKKSDCTGPSDLNEDDSGNLIPCITPFGETDGCVIEKRELSDIADAKNSYISVGKYESKYKQNPVDFVGSDGNIFFLIQNEGKHEFIKFSPTDAQMIEKIQVYDENDYAMKSVPSVMRAMTSGNVIWIVLNGSLYNMYVAPGNYGVLWCYGDTGSVYSGCNGSWGENLCFGMTYGAGVVFISKNYSGEEMSRVKNEVYCRWNREDVLDSHTGSASISGFNFDPTKMTYNGDGFGNLLVRSNTDLNEYSTDSNDVKFPSARR